MSNYDAFLKIDGIEDESEDAKHGKEIQLSSFTWGSSQPGTFGAGGGGGGGKVSFQDFHFTKELSKATLKLKVFHNSGKHIPKATLTLRKATGSGGQQDYYKITFEDVLISSYNASGVGSHGGPVPTESWSMAFTKYEEEYFVQDKGGKLASAGTVNWDVKKNDGSKPS